MSRPLTPTLPRLLVALLIAPIVALPTAVSAADPVPSVAATSPAVPRPPAGGAVGAPTATADKPSPVKVSASLSKPNPTFGDRLEVVVELRYPIDVRAFFPRKPDLKPLLTLPDDPGTVTQREENGETIEVLRIPVLVVKSGLLRTPSVEVPWHRVTASGGAGESGTATLPGLRIVVSSQFADETDVKPAALPKPMPLVEENVPLEIGLLVLIMMALAGALTAIGLRIYRNRALRAEPEPDIPPHIVAFGRIAELRQSERLEADEPRLVLGEISTILREYIGRRFRVPALDMTSTELLEALEGKDLRGIGLNEFQDFTSVGDLVKFARQPATPDFLGQQLAWIERVINRTMQTPEEVERLRQQQLARLARQKRLRIQVMAPAPLRLLAFGLDFFIGAGLTLLAAWLAIDTGQRGLFDASYGLFLAWLVMRDLLGEASPGKALVGLRIAEWDPAAEVDPDAVLREDAAAQRFSQQAPVASFGARLQRNLLMLLPGAGLVAEALTCWYLPEMRRLGDQWAETRVIDARYGLRTAVTGWGPGAVACVAAVVLLLLPLLVLGGRPL